ncbi:MAG: hypothetical protein OEY49_12105, partial [Candidatus Heimdallarchaeota archaeon]|nr:hypothetical protein [Candidatus Heimdallarchaeota archaeon]
DVNWLRASHIIFAFSWWSLLFFLAIILGPVIHQLSEETKVNIIGYIVPRVFLTVSNVGFLTISLGWYLFLSYYFTNLEYIFKDLDNLLLAIFAILTTLLYFFHIFLEQSEIQTAIKVREGIITPKDDEFKHLLKGLKIIPRFGFLLVTTTILVMFYHN